MISAAADARIDGGVLVCFAVKEEANPFKKTISGTHGISTLVTGMGRRNTERAFGKLLQQWKPSIVFTCGFAGALDPQLKIGDVLFDSDSNPNIEKVLRSHGALPRKFYCAERVAVTAAEKESLRRTTGADAVEMESSIIRKLCREHGIPSATVRAISDLATEDLPLDFNALLTSGQNLSTPRLIGALLRSPGKVPQLMKLQRNTTFATARLAEVLHKSVNALRSDRTAAG